MNLFLMMTHVLKALALGQVYVLLFIAVQNVIFTIFQHFLVILLHSVSIDVTINIFMNKNTSSTKPNHNPTRIYKEREKERATTAI